MTAFNCDKYFGMEGGTVFSC
uniref:Uncharacterized protein n=1 Tax=Arundo donax TaxID=35708 RepID=A0A0A8YF21_ARUDO